MKLATSLFVIVLIAIALLLFLGGPLIDHRPNAELCDAAYALVKRQLPNDAVRRAGDCSVAGSGALHTVPWAYSTATSREREMPPIAYEAKVAFDGKTYHLCSLNSLKRKQEFHHPLCAKRSLERYESCLSKTAKAAYNPRLNLEALRAKLRVSPL